MADFQLRSDEFVIVKASGVSYSAASQNVDLILTNLNLVCVEKKFFGGVVGSEKIPLDHIPLIGGRPNVRIKKMARDYYVITIRLKNGDEFEISGDKDQALEWEQGINEALAEATGGMAEKLSSAEGANASIVHEAVGAASAVLGAFGLQTKGRQKEARRSEVPKHATAACRGCGAPVAGVLGRRVLCAYCGTEQVLE